MSFLKTLLLSALALPSLCQYMSSSLYSVDFNGNSGGFKLVSNEDETFYNMRYGWLVETPQHKYHLDFLDFETGMDDDKVYVNAFIDNPDNGLYVEIKNEIYNEDMTIVNEKNQTVYIVEDSMKITLIISGWKFLDAKNTLTLDFTLSNNIGSSIKQIDENTLNIHKFNFVFESIAVVDDVEKPIKFYSKGNKYYLEFPYFQQDLYYDPSIFFITDNIQSMSDSSITQSSDSSIIESSDSNIMNETTSDDSIMNIGINNIIKFKSYFLLLIILFYTFI